MAITVKTANKTARLAATLATVLIAPLALSIATAPAAAAAAKPNARNDAISLVAGSTKSVAVLANDAVTNKKRAKVRVLGWPAGITATVTARRSVQVKVAATASAGTKTLRYRVTDSRRRSDVAAIKITVRAKAVTPPTTPPPPPVPPTPSDPAPTGSSTLRALVATLPVADERRTGYDRDLFKHWNSGTKADGCDTRREVLISEAVVAPTVGSGCSFTGGSWYSYYDGLTTTDASKFDIDHMTPLAEAWDSGAWGWAAERREAYANDQGDPRSLVAVTAASNRSKSDQDPAEWLPVLEKCRYVTDWTVVKHRWNLSADSAEKTALTNLAAGCPDTTVTFSVVP